MELPFKKLTEKIIGAAIEVHSQLGPGFIESVYENALVDDTIVVELKAVKEIEDIHFAIVKSYLKAIGKNHGLILNFAKTRLETKRVIYE